MRISILIICAGITSILYGMEHGDYAITKQIKHNPLYVSGTITSAHIPSQETLLVSVLNNAIE